MEGGFDTAGHGSLVLSCLQPFSVREEAALSDLNCLPGLNWLARIELSHCSLEFDELLHAP